MEYGMKYNKEQENDVKTTSYTSADLEILKKFRERSLAMSREQDRMLSVLVKFQEKPFAKIVKTGTGV